MNHEACLRSYPLFALLSPEQMATWLSGSRELEFPTGETIIQEGTTGIWTYLVMDGQVRVLRLGRNGREVSLGLFRPGDLFGEYALVPPGLNTATCRAAAPSRLLRLPLLPLKPLLQGRLQITKNIKKWMRLHALLHHLRDRAFLGFLSAPSALKYFDVLKPVTFPPARTIQADGLAQDNWFFIDSGQVRLHDHVSDQTRELGPGQCFGERALLAQEDLPLAVAATEVRCRYLTRAAFLEQLVPSNSVALQTVRTLALPLGSFPWVGQQEEADCGLAALVMAASCLGCNLTVNQLRAQIVLGGEGASMIQLQRLAQNLGLRSQPVRIGAEQWPQLTLPAIAHFFTGHFVTVYEISPEWVVVGDPASGVVNLSLPLFHQSCSGNVLLLSRPATSQLASFAGDN